MRSGCTGMWEDPGSVLQFRREDCHDHWQCLSDTRESDVSIFIVAVSDIVQCFPSAGKIIKEYLISFFFEHNFDSVESFTQQVFLTSIMSLAQSSICSIFPQ